MLAMGSLSKRVVNRPISLGGVRLACRSSPLNC